MSLERSSTVIMRSPSAMMLHQQIRPALSREVTPLTTMARLGWCNSCSNIIGQAAVAADNDHSVFER